MEHLGHSLQELLNTARYIRMLWNSNSSFSFWWFKIHLGNYTTATESYNGTSWTAVNSMNTARRNFAGAGTQTAALAFGGVYNSIYSSNRILEWNKLDFLLII
jgi:hypothetical protein